MHFIKTVLLYATLLLSSFLSAQPKTGELIFKNGGRVCFIGNSITANGQFHNFIALYYATRFPDTQVKFFNCGISGNTATGVIRRMETDILIHKPTWSVVMLGMNDVGSSLYAPGSDTIPMISEKRQDVLIHYRKNLELIIETLLVNKSNVILQKPSIYDQTGILKSDNYKGKNDALEKCCHIIDELAAKYKLFVVDYWTVLSQINRAMQLADPTATIIGADRVHPGVPGHFIMAYQFLKTTISPHAVAAITINAQLGTIQCANSTVRKFRISKDRIRFRGKINSFPFPVKLEAVPALPYTSFTNDYNRQVLQVLGIEEGVYRLYIDGADAGQFSADQLNHGINMALLTQSPLYSRSGKLLALFEQYLQTERELRSLRMVEFDFLKGDIPDDIQEIKKFLDQLLVTQYAQSRFRNYYKSQFDHYIEKKSSEGKLQDTLNTLFRECYKEYPVFHLFEIAKAN